METAEEIDDLFLGDAEVSYYMLIFISLYMFVVNLSAFEFHN